MPRTRPEQIVDQTQDATLHRTPDSVSPRSRLLDNHISTPYRLIWTRDKTDHRDFLFTAPQKLTVPTKIDLRNYCSVVNDQGSLGICTGEAVTSAMEIILKREGRLIELSRLFVYYQERLLEGSVNYDAGAYLRDGIKVCYTYGAAAESLWQFNPKMFRVKPPTAVYTDALKRKVTLYQRCTNVDSIRAALAIGNPVVVGFCVYSSFLSSIVTKTGIMPYPNVRTERFMGGHAVCLVGYDDVKRVFIAKNSWGSAWGDRGYFYMPYQVIQDANMSSDFWAIGSMSR
jgi:C1A family cysteine protease